MASRPIPLICQATLSQKPEEIAGQSLDLTKWPEFNGYGPLLGIKQAEFETKTAEIVGTRIRMTNRDGSTHVEEIVEWEPTRRLRLHMRVPGTHTPIIDRRLWDRGQTLLVADRGRHEIIDIAVKAFEISQSLREKWLTADYAAKRRILEILCLNWTLEGATLVPTMRKPFSLLAKGLLQKDSRGDRI